MLCVVIQNYTILKRLKITTAVNLCYLWVFKLYLSKFSPKTVQKAYSFCSIKCQRKQIEIDYFTFIIVVETKYGESALKIGNNERQAMVIIQKNLKKTKQ